MNIVLYTDNFEPITVLDLPLWAIEMAERRGSVRVAAMDPPKVEFSDTAIVQMRIAVIRAEPMRWKDGSRKTILVTDDEEVALMLKPSWLPGQRGSIQNYHQTIRAFAQAFMRGLS
jgi:hypothetical protein